MVKQINNPAATTAAALAAVAPTAAAITVIAVRGGAAVTKVRLAPGAVYRTKAPHNVRWWAAVQAAMANGPAPVATLVAPPPAGGGVPAHFVGYCLRRGYLVGV